MIHDVPSPSRHLERIGDVEILVRRRLTHIRGVHFSASQLIDFGRSLGPLRLSSPQNRSQRYPELVVLDGASQVGRAWHTDYCFRPNPPLLTLLYCVEAPREGGETCFLDTSAAYEGLPAAWKERVAALAGVFDFAAVFARKLAERGLAPSPEQAAEVPMVRPILGHHPMTGRAFLRLHEEYLVELRNATEVEPMRVELLLERIVRSAPVTTHTWAAGDLLIWDTRTMLHRRAPDPPRPRRRLWRVVVE